MNKLSGFLYTGTQIGKIERRAADIAGLDSWTLMQRAGQCAFQLLQAKWPKARSLTVWCGAGNNGGDGYVVAGMAAQAGWAVEVIALGEPTTEPARRALQEATQHSMRVGPTLTASSPRGAVLVDALLGTGLTRAPEGDFRAAIECMNEQARPVVSLDLPSGLDSDSGGTPGVAVSADLTVTFVGMKLGLQTGRGPDLCGSLVFDRLGLPGEAYDEVQSVARLIEGNAVARLLPPRPAGLHKGGAGHVLVLGGAEGMSGAARICAAGAFRVGAGLVTLATHSSHAAMANIEMPELMVQAVDEWSSLARLFSGKRALVVGPGLGRGVWGRDLFAACLEQSMPRVIDADALNRLAEEPVTGSDWVLTPHSGEAARLLGCSITEVEADRPAAVIEIQKRYGGVCVLKGVGTLVAVTDGAISLCDRGNPGMASAGMGDLLAGVIGGLLAQGLSAAQAACAGVWLHASAGDLAAGEYSRGLVARDLLEPLRRLVNRSCDVDDQ